MAFVLSTGLVNFLSGEGSLREAFDDCVLKLYAGSVPVTAEEAPGGTLLCPITIGSVAVASTDRSTPRVYKLVVDSDHTEGHTRKVTVTDPVGTDTTYTYTILAEDDTAAKVAIKVARMLNDVDILSAVPETDTANIWVMCRIAGLPLTLANGGGSEAVTPTAKQAAARSNALYFGPPTVGVISIAGGVWSGVNVATGVASFFRFVRPDDSGAASPTDIRLQGTISTSGADMNLSNTTLTVAATTTIDSGNFQEPKSE